jgi:hypothetical protein
MDRRRSFDGLHFDNKPFLNYEISPEPIGNRQSVELNRDWFLALNLKAIAL